MRRAVARVSQSAWQALLQLERRGMTTRRSSASQQSGSSGGGAAAAASAAAAAPTATGSSKQAGPRTTKRQRLLAPRGRGAAAYREPGPGTIELPGGSSGTVVYRTDLLSGPAAAALFQQLRAELPWEQRDVRVMGRVVAQPRLIAYQADGPELQYTYSGTSLQPAPWHPGVLQLKRQVEAATGACFNSCLLNLYRSGADSISWHSDNEPLYGEDPTIASVSLGTAREFLLRQNSDHAVKYRFRLGGGALLVMSGPLQRHWMHSIPRRPVLVGERLSLTFRTIKLPERARRV